MANERWELLVGLEVSKPVGVGVGGSARFCIEIVFEDANDFADGAMSVGIQISWIEIDLNLIAG